MIEKEHRYRISKSEKDKIYGQFTSWTKPSKVVDITFGLSGATSMIVNGWIIRLRQKEGKISLEYKASLNKESTLWEEYAVAIDSIKEAATILKKIGLKEGLVLDRIRTECVYLKYKITLDDFEMLGTFVEIELLDGNQSFSNIFEILGIPEREKEKPYGDIMLDLLLEKPEYYQHIKDYINSSLIHNKNNCINPNGI